MKKKSKILLGIVMLLAIAGMLVPAGKAEAASGTVNLSMSNKQPVKGEKFSVVVKIASTSPFNFVDLYLSYDQSIMEFMTGGSDVSGGKGTLRICTSEDSSLNQVTYSLQFRAKKAGGAVISVGDKAKVSNEDGDAFSVSSNRLSLTVVKSKKEQKTTQTEKEEEETKKSENTKLKTLKLDAFDMSPEFSPKERKYQVTVPYTTETLFYSYQLADPKASITVFDNEGLSPGQNTVTFQVTAESGRVKKYLIDVKRETKEETEERVLKEKIANKETGIGFQVKKAKGKIILRNDYEFQVQDPSSQTKMPSGYIQSKIQINGVEIPAYTMQNDLDNNYLLLYLKGPTGKSAIYQYDREEKTLQRYTGDMVEKVNRDGEEGYVTLGEKSSGSVKTTVLYVAIVALVLIILLMLAAMLKMISKGRQHKKKFDDIDF